MFENIIGQGVVEQIKEDFLKGRLPPSILFSGAEMQAKGTAALELARALSCEAAPPKTALWNCKCPSCVYHRKLSSLDMLAIGPRAFQAEINACKAVFFKELGALDGGRGTGRMLFVRAVRKLLLRFSPVLWEGEAKVSKLNSYLEPISENLDILNSLSEERCEDGQDKKQIEKIEKLCEKISTAALHLEAEGIGAVIPISHIKRASHWLRIMPNGRHKTLIIENADKMNSAARNSLLKILEEPPSTATIILTSAKPKSLLATILSRVRQYYFAQRGAEEERELLKRIFKEEAVELGGVKEREGVKSERALAAFFNGFLPVSKESLYPAAAYFWASTAAMAIGKNGAAGQSYNLIVEIGKHCAPIAEAAGLPKHSEDIKTMTANIIKSASKFEGRRLFLLFLELSLVLLCEALKNNNSPLAVYYRDSAKKHSLFAFQAVDVFNQSPVLVLERYAERILDFLK